MILGYTRVSKSEEQNAALQQQALQTADEIRTGDEPAGMHVLARARRARRPGIVFARAAAAGETDPLQEAFSRFFVGLPIQ